MGHSRSRSRKRDKKDKKEKKSKRDRSRSRSRPRRQVKQSKFSNAPPPGAQVQQDQSNPLMNMGQSGLGMGMQNQNNPLLGGQLPQVEIQSTKVQIPETIGGMPALQIGNQTVSEQLGNQGNQKPGIMSEEEFLEKYEIPRDPQQQSEDQKIQLEQFRKDRQQIESQIGQGGQINQNTIIQNILSKAGIQVDNQQKSNAIAGNSTYAYTKMLQKYPGVNPNIIAILTDTTKIKRKVPVPQNGFNYTGLIIGPQGTNQKKMEEATMCKILVRGKGSQKEGQVTQPDDHEEQHVLIVGDTNAAVAKAQSQVEKILFADEETRNKIRNDQLLMVAQIKNFGGVGMAAGLEQSNAPKQELLIPQKLEPSMTTPFGPPSDRAYIIPVPEDCVGLVIGKSGETIKQLQDRSGCSRVQVSMEQIRDSDLRNVFCEGTDEAIENVRKLLAEIVDNQRKMKQGFIQGQGTQKVEYGIPLNMVGLVVGKSGETVKQINSKTGAFVILSREPEHENLDKKIFLISGTPAAIDAAKREIDLVVENGIKYQQQKQQQQMGGLQQFGLQQPPMQQNFNNPLPPGFNNNNFGNSNSLQMPPPPNMNQGNQGGMQGMSLPPMKYSSQQQQPGQQNNNGWDNNNKDSNNNGYKYNTFQPPPMKDQGQDKNQEQNNSAPPNIPPPSSIPPPSLGIPPIQQQTQPQQPQFQPQMQMQQKPQMNTQQMLINSVEGPQIEQIGADEADEFETKRRRRRKKND